MYQQIYKKQDPVLLKLPSPAVSALLNANITCLENLFGLNERHILNIKGIGKKRQKQIIDLLMDFHSIIRINRFPIILSKTPMPV